MIFQYIYFATTNSTPDLCNSISLCLRLFKIVFDIFHHLLLLCDAIVFTTLFRSIQTAFYKSHQANDDDHRYHRPNEARLEVEFIAEQFAERLRLAIDRKRFLEINPEIRHNNENPIPIHTCCSSRPHSPFG